MRLYNKIGVMLAESIDIQAKEIGVMLAESIDIQAKDLYSHFPTCCIICTTKFLPGISVVTSKLYIAFTR